MPHLTVSVAAERHSPGKGSWRLLSYHCHVSGKDYAEEDRGRWDNYVFWVLCPCCSEVVPSGEVALLI